MITSTSHCANHRTLIGTDEKGATLWFTGLSSSGKTTLGRAVYTQLLSRGYRVEMLDGDEMRRSLCSDLGFSKKDRDENIRRIGFLAELLTRHGITVIVCAISPYGAIRQEIRRSLGAFVEVYVNAPLEVCEHRDVKGLYRKARAGEIKSFTGIDDPYEPPTSPEVECQTHLETIEESMEKILKAIGVAADSSAITSPDHVSLTNGSAGANHR
jgi:adenylylsulfate kinase